MCNILKELLFDLEIIFSQIENMNISNYEKLILANINVNVLLLAYYNANLIPVDLIVKFYLTENEIFEYDLDNDTLQIIDECIEKGEWK